LPATMQAARPRNPSRKFLNLKGGLCWHSMCKT
jgi:hypothetical protein